MSKGMAYFFLSTIAVFALCVIWLGGLEKEYRERVSELEQTNIQLMTDNLISLKHVGQYQDRLIKEQESHVDSLKRMLRYLGIPLPKERYVQK